MGNAFVVLLLCLCTLLQTILLALCAPDSALITSLPGFPADTPLPSAHYGGYIMIDVSHEKSLYYYLVTSERETAASDPLLLWLNGGPGGSSFDGFVYENGPFNYEPGSTPTSLPKLSVNPYSWSKAANVLYVDSPAGVGMSYSKNSSDYISGDLLTAKDLYKFLQGWFAIFSEYLPNPLYIIGESYAGVYIPTLSREIANGIAAGLEPKLNFKGYAIGNGCTDEEFDGNAIVPFVAGMGLISFDLYQTALKACHGNYWNDTSDACIGAQMAIYKDVIDVNIYNVLEPCYHSPAMELNSPRSSRLPMSFRRLGETERPMPVRKRKFGHAWPLGTAIKAGRVFSESDLNEDDDSVPCIVWDDTVAVSWLNTPAVREAIHAKPIEEIGPWPLYKPIIYYSDAGSMIPIHAGLTSAGYRALIYSMNAARMKEALEARDLICQYLLCNFHHGSIGKGGDHDMAVPFTGSEAWTRSLGYGIIDKWRPWYHGDQVAGFIQGYAHKLTFLTVKGAGHTVPEYKPAEALAFLTRWLADETI